MVFVGRAEYVIRVAMGNVLLASVCLEICLFNEIWHVRKSECLYTRAFVRVARCYVSN